MCDSEEKFALARDRHVHIVSFGWYWRVYVGLQWDEFAPLRPLHEALVTDANRLKAFVSLLCHDFEPFCRFCDRLLVLECDGC